MDWCELCTSLTSVRVRLNFLHLYFFSSCIMQFLIKLLAEAVVYLILAFAKYLLLTLTTTDKDVKSKDMKNQCFPTEHMLCQSGSNAVTGQTLLFTCDYQHRTLTVKECLANKVIWKQQNVNWTVKSFKTKNNAVTPEYTQGRTQTFQ